MDNSVERYRVRRSRRLGEDSVVDPVEEYKKRRRKRLDARRLDSNMNKLYGIAIGMGIDGAAEMEPPELIKALKGEGVNIQGALREGGNKKGSMKPDSRGYVQGWKPPKVSGMSHGEVNKTLSMCNHIGQRHYGKAGKVANDERRPFLWTFTTHGRDHVQQVIDKTNQAADAIEKMPQMSVFKGAKIDRKLMLVSAWFHDSGMDGGDVDWGNDNGDGIRSAHGTQSAIHILEHAKEIEKLGVDPNKAALIAFAHTKSKSGINDLAKPEDWKIGLDKLEAAAKENGVPFDRKAIFGEEPNIGNIREMAAQVAALRLGDANREAKGNDLYSQSGGRYEIAEHPDMKKVQKMIESGEVDDGWKAEVALSKITIEDDDGKHTLSDDDPKMSKVEGWRFSSRVVLGERNMEVVDTRYNDRHQDLQLDITLKNGDDVPWSTTEALLERCGEMNTINGIPRAMAVYMTGVKNWESLSKTTKQAYEKMWFRINNDWDKKAGQYKYAGVDGLVLVFDDGSKRGYYDEENMKRGNK